MTVFGCILGFFSVFKGVIASVIGCSLSDGAFLRYVAVARATDVVIYTADLTAVAMVSAKGVTALALAPGGWLVTSSAKGVQVWQVDKDTAKVPPALHAPIAREGV